MTTKMKMILAGAGLALAGCGGGGGAPPAADPVITLDPVIVPTVMSADVSANTVTVGSGLATIVVNAVDVDEETFSVTFGLPDGSSVTITDEDTLLSSDFSFGIGSRDGVRLVVKNDEGDIVGILIGFEFGSDLVAEGLDADDIAEVIDEAIFVLVRVDPAGDDPEEGDEFEDLGVDTYMVTGDETVDLPAGAAHYKGITISSVYWDGVLLDDHVTGNFRAGVDFETSTVELKLGGDGSYLDTSGEEDVRRDFFYRLQADDLVVDGSRYGGVIGQRIVGVGARGGFIEIDTADGTENIEIVGELLGAFYGEFAESTAGVYGATETALEAALNEEDVEIVGGFAANLHPAEGD